MRKHHRLVASIVPAAAAKLEMVNSLEILDKSVSGKGGLTQLREANKKCRADFVGPALDLAAEVIRRCDTSKAAPPAKKSIPSEEAP